MELTPFLAELMLNFDQSAIAYRQYLDGGKTFQFAQQIKLHNGKALQLMEENSSSMPPAFNDDINALIIHYKEWTTKWEKLAAERPFGPDDVFVFANDVTFPKQAAQNLEAAFKKINSQKVTEQKK